MDEDLRCSSCGHHPMSPECTCQDQCLACIKCGFFGVGKVRATWGALFLELLLLGVALAVTVVVVAGGMWIVGF